MSATKRHPRFDFHQLDPLPTSDELSSFYESQYYHLIRQGGRAPELRRMMEGGESARSELEWLRNTTYLDVADTLRSLSPSGNRVLDIGAGTGDFVSFLVERGFAAEGIEPALLPSEAARERGLNIATADLATWAADGAHEARYDAVVALNVLEHVPDPESFVDRCLKLLRPGGILALKVPNDFSEIQAAAQQKLQTDPWWVCVPDHVNYFNIASLRKFLESFGLDIVGQVTDFPMELFLLFGDDYTSNPEVGKQMHRKRQQLETALPADLRRRLYAAFASVGMGRAVTAFARK